MGRVSVLLNLTLVVWEVRTAHLRRLITVSPHHESVGRGLGDTGGGKPHRSKVKTGYSDSGRESARYSGITYVPRVTSVGDLREDGTIESHRGIRGSSTTLLK